MAASWPKSDVYPTTELLAGGMLLNHSDEAKKPTSLGRLENACNAGLELKTDSGRATAANALFWLATYTSEYPAEGESEAQMIRSETDKEVEITISEAKAEAEKLVAEGEAEYMRRLAAAYDTADKKEFYEFTLALDALKKSLTGTENTVILDENSALAQILMGNQ